MTTGGKRIVEVVGAVIVQEGRILCARRGGDGPLAGKWEFPGGKLEAHETGPDALVREIREELACTIQVHDEVESTTHEYDFATIKLTTYYASLCDGTPSLTEHSELRWCGLEELEGLDWAPADVPAVMRISAGRLP